MFITTSTSPSSQSICIHFAVAIHSLTRELSFTYAYVVQMGSQNNYEDDIRDDDGVIIIGHKIAESPKESVKLRNAKNKT